MQLATLALNRFHVLPSQFFGEDWYLIMDVLRNLNLRDAVNDSGEKFTASDTYEEQMELNIPRMQF